MAGYLGSKAVFISTALADIDGDLTVDGKVGIGTTSTTAKLAVDGDTHVDGVLLVNRSGSDGSILSFQKDNVDIGVMGTVGGKFYIGSLSGSDAFLKYESNIVSPSTSTGTARTNAIDLGKSVSTFKDLYLGGGVYLGGTVAANKLDDYEEGTWTPSIVGEVTTANGTYTKIGNVVTAHFRIDLPNIGFSQDPGVLQGIPFANNYSGSTSAGRSGGYITYNSDGKGASLLFSSSTDVEFRQDPGGTNLDRGTLAGNQYWGTLVYNTDS